MEKKYLNIDIKDIIETGSKVFIKAYGISGTFQDGIFQPAKNEDKFLIVLDRCPLDPEYLRKIIGELNAAYSGDHKLGIIEFPTDNKPKFLKKIRAWLHGLIWKWL